MILFNTCNNLETLELIFMVKNTLAIILIIVPVLIIVLSSIDLFKAIIVGIEDFSKVTKTIIKRISVGTIIFLLPTVVNLIIGVASELIPVESIKNGLASSECWKNANSETIEKLREIRRIEIEKKKAEEERKKKEEEERKKKEDAYDKENPNKENYSSGTVVVIAGIFYKPSGKSGLQGSKGTGPYGYNIVFWERLQKFISAGKSLGYTITPSSNGWRSYEEQVEIRKRSLQNGNDPKYTATPGGSNHGWSIASDLKYSSTAANDWALKNATQYGLQFRMSWEPWHIEPAVIRTM